MWSSPGLTGNTEARPARPVTRLCGLRLVGVNSESVLKHNIMISDQGSYLQPSDFSQTEDVTESKVTNKTII